jgi:DNA polymerase zeta
VPNEFNLFRKLIDLIRQYDPDILLGYDIQKGSWGYLVERYKLKYQLDFLQEISRVNENFKTHYEQEMDEYGYIKQSSLHATGRIFINVWRIMRKEVTLTSYSIENVVYNLLHKRIPKFSNQDLCKNYNQGITNRWKTLQYYISRVCFNLDLLEKLDFINQTSEFARIYGIDFYSVIIRGSQYRVESILCRISRQENFVMYSPNKTQVAKMNAAECIPLNLEPKSAFYSDPVLVLDFQSLYPSIIIAYNFCYSTLLGRISTVGQKTTLGCLDGYQIPIEDLELLKDHVNITPNGCVFVKKHVRQGVLGRMLQELLETRQMIKKSIKLYPKNKVL